MQFIHDFLLYEWVIYSLVGLAALCLAAREAFIRKYRGHPGIMLHTHFNNLIIALPFALFVTPPKLITIYFLAGASIAYGLATLIKFKLYETHDLGAVYPTLRALSLLCTVVLGTFLLGDKLHLGQWVGVTIMSVAIFAMHYRQRDGLSMTKAAFILSIIAACGYAALNTLEAFAVRSSAEQFFSFIVYGYIIRSAAIAGLTYVTHHKRKLWAFYRNEFIPCLVPLGLLTISYVSMMWAYLHGNFNIATVIMESKIAAGVLIGIVFLGEAANTRRLVCTAFVILGVLLVKIY